MQRVELKTKINLNLESEGNGITYSGGPQLLEKFFDHNNIVLSFVIVK